MSLTDELNSYENSLNSVNSVGGKIGALSDDVKRLRNNLINDFNIDDKGLKEDELTAVIGQLSSALSGVNTYKTDLTNKINTTKAEIERREREEREEREKREREEQEKNSKKS